VSVELYYESLCGGCRYFVETQLFPTFFKLRDTGILKVSECSLLRENCCQLIYRDMGLLTIKTLNVVFTGVL
jgi:hypothetical protein